MQWCTLCTYCIYFCNPAGLDLCSLHIQAFQHKNQETNMTTDDRPAFESIWADLRGVSFSQGWLNAGGISTRYLHAGAKDKPALILLHGVGGHAEAYARNLKAHSRH